MKPDKQNIALVLFSGGIDSTACIDFYIKNGFNVESLYIDFGQPSKKREIKAARKIAKYYNIHFSKINVKSSVKFKDGLIIGRNLFLLSAALMFWKRKFGIISIGIHAGTNYEDCGVEFTEIMKSAFDLYTNGRINLGTPFLKFNKAEIITYCIENEIPLELTYSCERGLNQPCGKCITCKDLNKIYACEI